MSSDCVEQVRRIALITSGGTYAERILVGLALQGIAVDSVLILAPDQAPPSSALGKLRRTLKIIAARAGLPLSIATEADPSRGLAGLARQLVPAGTLNSPQMLETLQKIQPDYLVLGGLGILGQAALEIPRFGTFNVHPAILPFARGVGVVARSIERGLPVGVTAHFVDRGIDTGQIIRRELIPVSETDTLSSLRHKAAQRSVEIIVDLVAGASMGNHPRSVVQTARYPYCHWPSAVELTQIEKKLRDGSAREVYLRWLELYGSHELPEDIDEHPRVEALPSP